MTANDVPVIYDWENRQEYWEVSNTQRPFTMKEIEDFVMSNQHLNNSDQMRFIICLNDSDEAIGCIDFFDYDPNHKRAGVGVLIGDSMHREKGYAKEALSCLVDYAKKHDMHQLYCNILEDNKASIRLFLGFGFQLIGVKKDWLKTPEGWKNEGTYQLML